MPLYAPVWRFLSKVEELPHDGRKRRKNEFQCIAKCDIFRAILSAKNDCSPAIFVNILLIKNKFMKNEHQKKSHIGSLLIRYLMKWFYAAVRTG